MATLRIYGSKPHTYKKFPLQKKIPAALRRGFFIKGAPDFIVEVLSESTRRMDLLYKTNVYARAGVKEYWILDGETKALSKGTLAEDGNFFNFEIVEALGTIALNTQNLSINFDEVFQEAAGFLPIPDYRL
jgi:Uma2 family endonuclease